MGVSGGSLSNIIMTLYGKSIHAAVATSAGLGVPIAVAGTIGFMLAGLPHQSLMPPLSHRLRVAPGLRADGADLELSSPAIRRQARPPTPRRRLEIVFGLFLATMSVRFLVKPGVMSVRMSIGSQGQPHWRAAHDNLVAAHLPALRAGTGSSCRAGSS